MNVGKRLRELREARGMSQRDVQNLTGFMCSYVSRIENGHTMPSLPQLERWAKALDVELSNLFNGEHTQPRAAAQPERATKAEAQERTLFGLFGKMADKDRALL